jgi:hypothetical protein
MIVLGIGKEKYLMKVNLFECVGKTIFIWCSIAGFHVKTRKKEYSHPIF